MLSSTATKREARSYLSRFNPPGAKQRPFDGITSSISTIQPGNDLSGVNLGRLYLSARAVDESPVFEQTISTKHFIDRTIEPIHVALVKVKASLSYDDKTLNGVGRTLSQLARLGLSCVVVLDNDSNPTQNVGTENQPAWRKIISMEADRVAAAIECHGGQGVRRFDSVIGVSKISQDLYCSIRVRSGVQVVHRDLLLATLRRGSIPVIVPVGYTLETQTATLVAADEVMLALTRDFAGINPSHSLEEDATLLAGMVRTLQHQLSLDRIIILDPCGGIPSTNRPNGSHVFINLEQEYEDIKEELSGLHGDHKYPQDNNFHAEPTSQASAASTAEHESVAAISADRGAQQLAGNAYVNSFMGAHLSNLQLTKDCLALLPPSSSALITTPEEAANSSRRSMSPTPAPGVGTRSQRNPLIHNLLTDKPIVSSSLPITRLGVSPTQAPQPYIRASPTTFVKRGMPITIIPDPRTHPWQPPTLENPSIQLSDPRIDLPRLIHLIEDSFGRKLDVAHYLARVSSNLAGIIIAGSYEGGALLTWETPPNYSKNCLSRQIPYLDKFAVLKRSQGTGGVADIVFSAMVRDCFPEGVCWRSRRSNPVNKWYFERAEGTWFVPDTGWTMFWTTKGIAGRQFEDYESICASVLPSWADKTGVLD